MCEKITHFHSWFVQFGRSQRWCTFQNHSIKYDIVISQEPVESWKIYFMIKDTSNNVE